MFLIISLKDVANQEEDDDRKKSQNYADLWKLGFAAFMAVTVPLIFGAFLVKLAPVWFWWLGISTPTTYFQLPGFKVFPVLWIIASHFFRKYLKKRGSFQDELQAGAINVGINWGWLVTTLVAIHVIKMY